MPKRFVLFALLAVIALIAAAAAGYWFWWAGQLERGIAQWREQERSRGYQVDFVGPAIDGFPLAHVTHFDAPTIQTPTGALWRGPSLTARSPLWDPRSVAVTFTGRHVLEHLNAGRLDSAILDSRDAVGLLRLHGDGRLESADATVRGLEVLAAPLGQFTSDFLHLQFAPAYEQDSGALVALTFSVEARALQVPAALAGPLDATADKIVAAGRLEGIVPATEPRLALAAWRDAGGELELERLEIEWPPLGVTASGRLVLDDQLRPEGELATRIAGLPELLDRLAAQGLMTAEQVSTTKLAVFAFAGKPDAEGRPVLAVPVILRAGILYLGPFPLARVSPVL